MSPYAKFGLDRPSHSAGHQQQTDRQTGKHIAFYYVDCVIYLLNVIYLSTCYLPVCSVSARFNTHKDTVHLYMGFVCCYQAVQE